MFLCLCCSSDVKPLPAEPVLWSAQSPAVGLGRINADILLRPNSCRMVANGDAWHQFCMAAYVCSGFYKSRKNMVLAFVSSIYLGIMLPSLAIGNNQYTCFSVGRTAYHSLDSYPGIFYVEDKKTEKVGLRDRYGLLVKPEYESFRYHTPSHWFGELELRKNGYYTLYDICNDKYRSDDDIDHQLQDHICQIVEKHLAECSYQADDRLEVKVTVPSTNKTLAHVKVLKMVLSVTTITTRPLTSQPILWQMSLERLPATHWFNSSGARKIAQLFARSNKQRHACTPNPSDTRKRQDARAKRSSSTG